MKYAIVMDSIESIQFAKDSTLAMLLEIQSRNIECFVLGIEDLYLHNGQVKALVRKLEVFNNPKQWYQWQSEQFCIEMNDFDVVLMRKDPPFNMDYLYACYLLEMIDSSRTRVVNNPTSLRSANEKLFATYFKEFMAQYIVSANSGIICEFLAEQKDVVLKPLDGMGGTSIFRLKEGDMNRDVIIETMTEMGNRQIMVQRYIPEIVKGDNRILMIDGVAYPHCLRRIPPKGQLRGNLAKGATGQGSRLTLREQAICGAIGPQLKKMGLIFVGIDIIGDYLSEINVTSPTCIREIDKAFDVNVSGVFLDAI